MKITWNPDDPARAVIVTDEKTLEQQDPQLFERTLLFGPGRKIEFCKVMLCQGELSGTFVIPKKTHPIIDRLSFGFILSGKTLYFIGERDKLSRFVDGFMKEYAVTIDSPYKFLLRFMNYVIQEDVYFLEDYNERLQDIEEDIFAGHNAGMERFIMMARRDMNILENYYLQLSTVGETMQQTIIPQNVEDESAMVSLFITRANQLLSLVDEIKDYTSQIWNLRQTQLSDRQNKISTLLTIISTIFLPLTFITGWYGMNFRGMPLIDFRYGYGVILVIVALIVTLEVHFIRKNHWLTLSKKGDTIKKKDEKRL